jgi:hypothetical protein
MRENYFMTPKMGSTWASENNPVKMIFTACFRRFRANQLSEPIRAAIPIRYRLRKPPAPRPTISYKGYARLQASH